MISIQLSKERALVLFELLSRFTNEENLNIEDQAEERVLWDILSDLESILTEPFDPDYKKLLETARSNIRDELV